MSRNNDVFYGAHSNSHLLHAIRSQINESKCKRDAEKIALLNMAIVHSIQWIVFINLQQSLFFCTYISCTHWILSCQHLYFSKWIFRNVDWVLCACVSEKTQRHFKWKLNSILTWVSEKINERYELIWFGLIFERERTQVFIIFHLFLLLHQVILYNKITLLCKCKIGISSSTNIL